MRFLDGIAIGGMLPIAWALNIEFVPKRMRATIITVIMMGVQPRQRDIWPAHQLDRRPIRPRAASVLAGKASIWPAARGTLVVALALALWLPESMRFLVTKGLKPQLVVKTLRRLDPQDRHRPE